MLAVYCFIHLKYSCRMIEYIISNNIDTRILQRSAQLLNNGGVIALPTDTSWIIACSALSKAGVDALRLVSTQRDERHFTFITNSISMAGDYCALDNTRFRLIKRLSPGPYVFILDALHGTSKKLSLRRGEIGLRIPNHPVPLALCQALGEPLYSITAKRSLIGESAAFDAEELADGFAIPEEDLFDEAWELEAIEGVDLILDSGEDRPRIQSTVLDIRPGEVEVLRQGAGVWPA